MGPALAAGFVTCAALLASAAPVTVGAWSVFLFAGPHNWMEARYFASRLPVRWGRELAFFLAAIAGVCVLAVWRTMEGGPWWHSALAAWLVLLWRLRGHAADGAAALGCLWAAGAQAAPYWADVAMAYAHPLVALWFLDRQIRRSRPEWAGVWRKVAAAVPALAVAVVLFGSRVEAAPAWSADMVWKAGSPALV